MTQNFTCFSSIYYGSLAENELSTVRVVYVLEDFVLGDVTALFRKLFYSGSYSIQEPILFRKLFYSGNHLGNHLGNRQFPRTSLYTFFSTLVV